MIIKIKLFINCSKVKSNALPKQDYMQINVLKKTKHKICKIKVYVVCLCTHLRIQKRLMFAL